MQMRKHLQCWSRLLKSHQVSGSDDLSPTGRKLLLEGFCYTKISDPCACKGEEKCSSFIHQMNERTFFSMALAVVFLMGYSLYSTGSTVCCFFFLSFCVSSLCDT